MRIFHLRDDRNDHLKSKFSMRSSLLHLEGEVACPGGPYIVKSHVQEVVGAGEGSLCGAVQCIMDMGHMMIPCKQTDMTENMTIFSNLTPEN